MNYILIKSKYLLSIIRGAFPMAQQIKNPPALQETRIWSLGQEDALEEGKATQSTILAWRIPWTEEPRGLQFMGSQRSRTQLSDWACIYHGVDEFCAWPPTGPQPKFSGNNLQTNKELASTLILTCVYLLKGRGECWKGSDSKDSVYCCEGL